MKLRELVETTKKPERVCEYLTSIGIKFEKTPLSNGKGADFELTKSSPKQVQSIVDDILNVSEITDNFDVGYAGGTEITVRYH